MKRLVILCLLGVLLTAWGCVQSMSTSTQMQTLTPPPVAPMDESQFSPDMQLVTAAIIEQMRGSGQQVMGVTFDPAGSHDLQQEGFRFENFWLESMGITAYAAIEPKPGYVEARLEGVMVFKDMINRSASVFFGAEYTLTNKGLVIVSSAVGALPPVAPRLETFIVPADKLKAAKSDLQNFTDLYLFALDQSVPMTPLTSEGSPVTKGEHLIMTFCMERLKPASTMEMKVTQRSSMSSPKVADTAYIYDQGWRIMVAGGKFTPGSALNRFYVNVEYKAMPGVGEPLLLATYENKVQTPREPTPVVMQAPAQTAPQPAAQQPAAQQYDTPAAQPYGAPAPQAYGTPAEGPLAQGKAYLNLSLPEDVGVIQTRLKALGYYTMGVDRQLGPGTKDALDRFAEQNGLPKGVWTLEMQQLLFKGSGL